MSKMRRWSGTRWIDYAKGEKVPDVGPLMDIEREYKCRAGEHVKQCKRGQPNDSDDYTCACGCTPTEMCWEEDPAEIEADKLRALSETSAREVTSYDLSTTDGQKEFRRDFPTDSEAHLKAIDVLKPGPSGDEGSG